MRFFSYSNLPKISGRTFVPPVKDKPDDSLLSGSRSFPDVGNVDRFLAHGPLVPIVVLGLKLDGEVHWGHATGVGLKDSPGASALW